VARLYCKAAAQRRQGLQRLFSAFPGGSPGVGLLLLRVAVGVTAVVQGGSYLTDPGSGSAARLAGLIVIASGVSLLIGFLTPVAGVLMALATIGIARSWVPPATSNLFNTPLPAFLVVIIAAAITLLGPGSLSVDRRLFGRREIIIPHSPRMPRS
jgi:uncharacterized membrane protein YphA (DoxX/SURF4 family)